MTSLYEHWRWLRTDNNYFVVALLVFIASYILLPTSKQVNNVYYFSFLPVAIAFFFRNPTLLKPRGPELWLWTVFFSIATIMGLLGTGSIQYFKHIAYTLIFVFSTSLLTPPHFFRTPEFKRYFFWCVCVYIVASSLFYWGTGEYAVGERILWLPGRMTGPIYTSIYLAACLALAVPALLLEKRYFELMSATILSTFCISYLLQSRSGLVGLLAIPFFLLAGSNKKLSLSTMASTLIPIIVIFVITKNLGILDQLIARGDSLRSVIWQEYLSAWQQCGLIQGCGLEHKELAFIWQGTQHRAAHPHNIFLAISIRYGLLMLLPFIALMLLTLWRARKNQDSWGLYLGVALVMLCFDGDLLIGNPDELWLLVLLPASLIINQKPFGQERASLNHA